MPASTTAYHEETQAMVMSTYVCVKELHGILDIASSLSLIVTKGRHLPRFALA